jgi:hypothetical protein
MAWNCHGSHFTPSKDLKQAFACDISHPAVNYTGSNEMFVGSLVKGWHPNWVFKWKVRKVLHARTLYCMDTFVGLMYFVKVGCGNFN